MTENINDSPSGPEKPMGGDGRNTDAEVSRWIKNLGALVTIFAALAGIWLTAYQLNLKAQADKEAALNNKMAEDDKLRLGTLQIKDQVESRRDQALQHKEDNELQRQIHLLDIQHEQDVAAAADAKINRDRLSASISHMFASQTSSEGDLATLFEHVNRDAESRQIIENAVLARLENPRSLEEIELGFRLLEQIGPAALDSTAQANRSARNRYDDYLQLLYGESTKGVPARLQKLLNRG